MDAFTNIPLGWASAAVPFASVCVAASLGPSVPALALGAGVVLAGFAVMGASWYLWARARRSTPLVTKEVGSALAELAEIAGLAAELEPSGTRQQLLAATMAAATEAVVLGQALRQADGTKERFARETRDQHAALAEVVSDLRAAVTALKHAEDSRRELLRVAPDFTAARERFSVVADLTREVRADAESVRDLEDEVLVEVRAASRARVGRVVES